MLLRRYRTGKRRPVGHMRTHTHTFKHTLHFQIIQDWPLCSPAFLCNIVYTALFTFHMKYMAALASYAIFLCHCFITISFSCFFTLFPTVWPTKFPQCSEQSMCAVIHVRAIETRQVARHRGQIANKLIAFVCVFLSTPHGKHQNTYFTTKIILGEMKTF